MANNQPKDPVGGDTGWANYSLWLVSYTSRQGILQQVTYFASSSTEALSFLAKDYTIQFFFGPVTGASAAPTVATGVD